MVAEQAPISYPFPASPTIYHPAPELRALLDSRPVAPVSMPDGKTAWLVTRNADVRQVLVDPRFSRAAASAPEAAQTELSELVGESVLGLDPPEHTRIRSLVAKAFTARRVEQLRPRVVALVDDLLDKLEAAPRPVDLVENFSLPLPVQVICEMIGVPPQDRPEFHAWSDAMLGAGDATEEEKAAAMRGMSDYFAQLIAAKRAQPTDDLMSALIAARDADDDRLSERELVMLGIAMLIGGHETSANQINLCLLTLLHYPEQMKWLSANLDSVGQAVEEMMRFIQLGEGGGLPRIAMEEVELGGVRLPAGSAVLPALGLANRDPSVFEDPDRFDLSRKANQHMSFGAGVHHCLGAQLARMEIQEALRGLLRRLPGIRVSVPDDELRFKPGMVLRSLETLPVTW
ncbi:MAG: cytochrome P450 [Micromonosporaceae bacterium]|nr:cytochrome P450 [Micromonosporaceae bacterium]